MPRRASGGTVTTFLVAVAVALLIVSDARAQQLQVDVSFPLGEHYRPGRYLPVRIATRGGGGDGPLRVEASGAVPTEVATHGAAIDAVVPLLAVTTLKDARWSAGGASVSVSHVLRPLADDERMIGTTATDADSLTGGIGADLFPGKKLIVVPLNLSDPLPGPAIAWGTLDAVLLDAAAAARVDERQLATLLAGETTVGVRSSAKPGGGSPWEKQGAWWVVRADLAGPGDLIEPLACEPVAAWAPGWPASSRRTLVLALVAFSNVAVALTLWRSRFATLAIVLIAVLAAGGVVAWRAAVSGTRTAYGVIVVERPGSAQIDAWTYHRALADGDYLEHAFDVTRPVFGSRRHFEQAGLTLHAAIDPSQPPQFRFMLGRGRTIAFLHRRVDLFRGYPPGTPPQLQRVTPITFDNRPSPLRRLAERSYVSRDARLLGSALLSLPHDLPDDYESWPAVFIDRGSGAAWLTPTPSPATAPAVPPR